MLDRAKHKSTRVSAHERIFIVSGAPVSPRAGTTSSPVRQHHLVRTRGRITGALVFWDRSSRCVAVGGLLFYFTLVHFVHEMKIRKGVSQV